MVAVKQYTENSLSDLVHKATHIVVCSLIDSFYRYRVSKKKLCKDKVRFEVNKNDCDMKSTLLSQINSLAFECHVIQPVWMLQSDLCVN